MKNVPIAITGSLLTILLVSCSSSNKLSNRLQGSWKIDSYTEQHVGEEQAAASNIGSITFNDDKTGRKRISYRILRNEITDTSLFFWSTANKTVTIQGENSPFAKTWIVMKNKNKMQIWQSTDGKGNVQSIRLKK